MRLITFEKDGGLAPGIALGDGILDIAAGWTGEAGSAPNSLSQIIRNQKTLLPAIEELLASIPADSPAILDASVARLGPAVPDPGKIICVGLNYRQHAVESKMPIPAEPVLFSKFGNSVAAAGQDIDITGFNKVDYESELAVVIGRSTRCASTADALNSVFGYCNANDLSDRDLQFRSNQWLLGKTLDHFCPLGPYLVTAGDVPDPQNLEIKGWLNGELRQNGHTSDMIFTVAEIISYISSHFSLEAGDVILTGTPFGVILGMEEQLWMQAGDEYTVEIGNLGRLSNRMVK